MSTVAGRALPGHDRVGDMSSEWTMRGMKNEEDWVWHVEMIPLPL